MTTSESDEENKSHMSMDNWLSEKKVPCDRPGDDEDMAQAILMLARNRYVNGQTVVVDGGLLFGMVSATITSILLLIISRSQILTFISSPALAISAAIKGSHCNQRQPKEV